MRGERGRDGGGEGERQWGGAREGGWVRRSAVRSKPRANMPLLLYKGAGRWHIVGRTRWPIGAFLIVFSLTKTHHIISELL